jgi:transcriptional regulator with XRE-family HTH domain
VKPELLRTERKLREWSQAEVAEAVGVSTKTVSRWEQGLAVPHPYYRNKLVLLFGKTEEELGLLTENDQEEQPLTNKDVYEGKALEDSDDGYKEEGILNSDKEDEGEPLPDSNEEGGEEPLSTSNKEEVFPLLSRNYLWDRMDSTSMFRHFNDIYNQKGFILVNTLKVLIVIISAFILVPSFRGIHIGTPWSESGHQNLAGYWNFDEGSGSVTHDSSGNGHTGILQSGASWAAGKVGPYALSLGGSSDSYVDISTPVVDTTKSYTFAAWVLLNDTSDPVHTAISIDGDQMSGSYLQYAGGEFCFCAFSADSSSAMLYRAATNFMPNVGQWYHLAGVYDATTKTIVLYVNGSLVQSTFYPGAWRASGHTLIGRGKYDGRLVDFWPGLIDDVRIYNTALSASNIRALANG